MLSLELIKHYLETGLARVLRHDAPPEAGCDITRVVEVWADRGFATRAGLAGLAHDLARDLWHMDAPPVAGECSVTAHPCDPALAVVRVSLRGVSRW